MTKPQIGLIGVGLMGHGIAANLLRKGYALTVLEHAGNQPLDELLELGVATRGEAAALARASDVVILCVTGTPEVEAVLLSAGGVLEGLRPGSTVIDCSTAIPSSTERIAASVIGAGARFLDAPMTRTPKEAAEGRLNLLVGGDLSVLEECRPVLASFAENIVHAGPVGAGHRMKLLHNFVSLGSVALLAEAAACAARSGVDPDVFVEVLAKGGGAGVALERMRSVLTTGDGSNFRFAIANAAKDLGYYATMAGETGAAGSIAGSVLSTYRRADTAAGPGAMVPDLVALLTRGV